MDKTLADIASMYLDLDTLDTRGRDNLDNYELDVQSLREALVAAYYAGYAASVRAANGHDAERLATEQHTVRDGNWLYAGAASPKDGPKTVVTLPIPELKLLDNRWREHYASTVLIPAIVAQRRID